MFTEDFVINFVLFLILAWALRRWIESRVLATLHERMAEIEQTRLKQPVPLMVEEIEGRLYCWHAETKDFVCQGADLQELRDNFKLRYPGQNAHVQDGPEQLLHRLRQELKHLRQNENLNSQ